MERAESWESRRFSVRPAASGATSRVPLWAILGLIVALQVLVLGLGLLA